MVNVWFISDTHFGHANTVTKFTRKDGSPLRDFSDVNEMDEFMVQQWNNVVQDQDHVYHLGDVVINKKNLSTLHRLKGKKRLVRGNHDIFDDELYREHFAKIFGVRVLKGGILSHIPIHVSSMGRFAVNVHGHLHANTVKIMHGNQETSEDDPRYINVSVEQINYTPIHIDEVRQIIKDRNIDSEFKFY